MKTGISSTAFCLLTCALLSLWLGACAQLPVAASDPDFSKGYEEGRVAAKKDAAGYKCLRGNRKFEGSLRSMQYEKTWADQQRSPAYIQGFRMGFGRFFNYYVDIYCPDMALLP